MFSAKKPHIIASLLRYKPAVTRSETLKPSRKPCCYFCGNKNQVFYKKITSENFFVWCALNNFFLVIIILEKIWAPLGLNFFFCRWNWTYNPNLCSKFHSKKWLAQGFPRAYHTMIFQIRPGRIIHFIIVWCDLNNYYNNSSTNRAFAQNPDEI